MKNIFSAPTAPPVIFSIQVSDKEVEVTFQVNKNILCYLRNIVGTQTTLFVEV